MEIPVIYGDGVGEEVTTAGIKVINSALDKVGKSITWKRILAGEEAFEKTGEYLPQETMDAIKEHKVAIKGPLATPIGGGIRSLNVTLRQELDLFACVRPVKWFTGVPAPVKNPEKLDVIIFRENTEDVYSGIEFKEGSESCKEVINFINSMGNNVRSDSGIGIKPISIFGTKRIVKAAIEYAIKHGRKKVTMVHKGNIMKFTEGAFNEWGYEVAKEYDIEVNDVIADAMFQQLLLRPNEYDVIVTTNLNGDYLSDACAAQVGGLGLAPGGNINYNTGIALFEATHGTAPKYKGLDKVNPGSFILSGVMMLQHIGYNDAADLILSAVEKTILQKKVTYDLERQMEGATLLKCSEFADAIIGNM